MSDAKPQLPPAALAQRRDTEPRRLPLRGARLAVDRQQLIPAEARRRIDDDLGQVGQLGRELAEGRDLPQDLAHIHPEHLAVLERVQPVAAYGRGGRRGCVGGSRQLGSELRGKLGAGLAGRQRVHVLHHGEEVGVLHPQEVIPQEIADAQQPGQCAEHLGALQRGQLIGPRRPNK